MSSVGADPEFIVVDPRGRAVPAHRWFPPKAGRRYCGGGSVYRDGFAVELNPAYSHCRGLMEDSVKALFIAASNALPKGHRLVSTPAIGIDTKLLVGAPPDVATFGCEPSTNAYTGQPVVSKLKGAHPFRYAAGHLHIGYDKHSGPTWVHDPQLRALFVRMVDLYAGVPLTCLLHSRAQYLRRRHYGFAGDMRYQQYSNDTHGVEWRVPGADIWNNNALVSLALGIMREIGDNFEHYAAKHTPAIEPAVVAAINTGVGRLELVPESFHTDGDRLYSRALIHQLASEHVFAEFGLPYAVYEMHAGWREWCMACGVGA